MAELDTSNLEIELAVLEAQNAELEAQIAEERKLAFQKFAQEVEQKLLDRSSQRSHKEAEWLENMRLFLGQCGGVRATADNPFPKEANRPTLEAKFNVVRTKCEIAIAQCLSQQFAGGERNWDLTIDADSEDPQGDLMRAEAMERRIESQLTECRYPKEVNLLTRDKVILGSCVVKGPLQSTSVKKRHSVATTAAGTQIAVPSFAVDRTPTAKRVNPWFFFPDDTVLDFAHSEDTVEIHPYSKTELRGLKLAKDSGFDVAMIDELLEENVQNEFNGRKYYDFGQLAGNTFALKNKYCLIEYHGPCTIDDLGNYGVETPYDTPSETYYVEAWVCQGRVLYFQLSAIEGANRPPYAVDVWEQDPSHIFGIGMPSRMGIHQRVINSTYQILLDNLSNSSGPQLVIDKESIEPAAAGEWELRPNKVWYHRSLGQTSDVSKAMYFFNVPSVSKDVRESLEMARGFAEEESGIPLLIAGLGAAQVVEGQGQQAMIMQAATVGLEQKNQEFDENINDAVVHWFIDWNMQYGNRPDLVGNYSVDVRTSSEYRSKQIRIKDMEKLSVEITQNPSMGEWVNVDELIHARFALMQLPSKGIIKSVEEVEQGRQQQAPDPEQIKMEIESRKVAVAEKTLELNQKKLSQEGSIQQQRELWEHEEKMSANAARFAESEAAVLKASTEERIEMLRLAQKDGSNKEALLAQVTIAQEKLHNDKFLAGLDHSRGLREQLLQQEELELARKTGSGALSTV